MIDAKKVSALLREAEQDLRARKANFRETQRAWARGEKGSWPRFLDLRQLRVTILAASLAHSRGRMHFQRIGHWWDYQAESALKEQNVYQVPSGEKGFEWQKRTVLSKATWLSKFYGEEIFTQEEHSMVKNLLDAGDARRSGRDRDPGEPDMRRPSNAVGM